MVIKPALHGLPSSKIHRYAAGWRDPISGHPLQVRNPLGLDVVHVNTSRCR